MRIGFASDIHQLVEGRKLVLAGVNIPFELGELAHSDGDVVYHALSEAILGALALGDLGKYYPQTDEYKDIDSSIIVKKTCEMMFNKSYEINNVDISITTEKPKLAPYINKMRENTASLLKTHVDNVSIKACTNERMDDIGKGIAIKADAVVLLKKKGR